MKAMKKKEKGRLRKVIMKMKMNVSLNLQAYHQPALLASKKPKLFIDSEFELSGQYIMTSLIQS